MNDENTMTPPDEPLALDADLRAAIDDALVPQTVDAEVAARIKRRLLDRIAGEAGLQVAVPADGGAWRPFVPGVELKVLHRNGETLSYLLRMAPGSELPNHRHPQDEECVVVEGRVEMGGMSFGPGAYLMERAGTLHAPLRTVDGALLFLRGATPRAEHRV